MTEQDYFGDNADAERLFAALARKVARLGEVTVTVSKSQIAFRRRHTVATVWMPRRYLKGPRVAPLVLTVSFPSRHRSPRWKEVTKVSAHRFTHHLEIRRLTDLDKEVMAWIKDAWEAAG